MSAGLEGYSSDQSVGSQRHHNSAARAAADAAEAEYIGDNYHRIDDNPRSVYPPLRASDSLPHVPGTPARQGMVAAESVDPEAAAMHELHHRAIRTWSWRVKAAFGLHMITALCLLHSNYWMTTIIGTIGQLALDCSRRGWGGDSFHLTFPFPPCSVFLLFLPFASGLIAIFILAYSSAIHVAQGSPTADVSLSVCFGSIFLRCVHCALCVCVSSSFPPAASKCVKRLSS